MKNRILQAYKQAPWRIQTQWVGLFLLGLVLITSIIGVYLGISGQAAEAGRNIQLKEQEINEIENEIAQLTADLAAAKSIAMMKERGIALDFIPLDPHEAIYLVVQGYNPFAKIALAPPKLSIIVESPTLLSSYRVSLWDWMKENIWSISFAPVNEVTP